MFLIYKIIIVGVFLLSIVFYSFNVPYVFLYIIIVVIVHNKEDLRYLLGNKVWKIYLKVRNQKSQVQLLSDREAYIHGTVPHSTPIMQNSYMKSTKPTYSPTSNDSRTGLFNGLTSTPLSSSKSHLNNSLFLRNKLTPLRSPPLYNLSEVSNVNNKSPKPVQNASGPLLASTRFNVSLGTYSDTKSPGLTNRIVQYNNEAKQKQLLTHQPKYGSPGLFPVVHFFKKDVPTVSPQPRKVTVRIASPDTSWYNSPEFGTKKVENKSPNAQNGPTVAQTTTDTETRSVLDALKEISRKRIHTTPDFETEQDVCKRPKRTEKLPNTLDSAKRSREEDSPVSDSQNKNVIQQTAKKICVVDMLAASYTSSQLYKEKMEKSLKKKAEMEKAEKEKKLLNVATQTTEPELSGKTAEEDSRMEVEQSNPKPFVIPLRKPKQKTDDNTKKEEAEQLRNAFIFDEGRLEIYRKNRLTTFLCALTGQKPVFLKYEKPQLSPEVEPAPKIDTPTTSPPKLVSILSPQNKPKHDKHVTFNLPPESNEDSIQTVSSNAATNPLNNTLISSTTGTPIKNNVNIIISNPETPKSALTAPAVIKLDFGKVNPHTEQENVTKLPEISVTPNEGAKTSTTMQNQTSIATIPSTLSFSFGNKNTAITTSVSSLNATTSSETFPIFSPPTTSTSPKTGGFKFDLTKPPSELSVTSTSVSSTSSINQNIPSFGFTTAGQIPEVKSQTALPGFNMPQATAATSPAFAFRTNTTSSSGMFPTTETATFGTNNVSQSALPSAAAQPTTTSNSFGSNTINFGTSSATSTTTTNVFGTQSTQQFGGQSSGVVTNSAFGTQPNTQMNSGFTMATTTPNTSAFGSAGISSSTHGFGVAAISSAAPAFANAAVPSNIPAFGTVITSAKTPAFGSAITAANVPAFGTGITTSNPSTFGTTVAPSSIPAFGTTVTSPNRFAFGTSTTSSTIPAFGTTITSSSTPGFGTTTTSSLIPGFGTAATSLTTPGFGTAATSSTTPSFGTTATSANTPGFGTATASGNMPSFGNSIATNSTPAFGTPSNTPAFGLNSFSNPTTTSTTSVFGFGTPTTTTAQTIPAFGTTTTSSTLFGTPTTSTTSFAPSASGFGTNTSAPVFGTNTSAPAFGTPSIANTTSSALFVTNPASQTFNTNTVSSGIFENNNENKPFAFGTNQSTLGANNVPTTKQPNFNFVTTTTSTAGFNSKPIPSFGSSFSGTNVFGASSSNQTPTTTSASNIFKSPSTTSFGSNSNQFGGKPENTFGGKTENTFGGKTENVFSGKSENNFGTFNNSFGAGNAGFGTSTNTNNAFGSSSGGNFGPNTVAGGFGTSTSNNNAFGTASNNNTGFGGSSNTPGGFGANASTGFGANTNNSGFSANASSNNNSSNVFPITSGSSAGFGTTPNTANANTFGGNNSAGFGTATNNNTSFGTGNVFGNANPAPASFGFSSGDAGSAFTKPQTSSAVFGNEASGDSIFQFNNSNNSTFGSGTATNAAPSGQSGIFSFGSSNPPAAPASSVFTFGSNEAKPGFNFNPNSNAAPGFGAASPNFNSGSATNFNPQAQFGGVQGVFNIGSGSTSGNRSRTPLKPKRRT